MGLTPFGAVDAALHRLHYGKAAEAAQAITVAENRALFEATFRVVPKPG